MVQIPRWQIIVVIAVLLAGIVFASPNLLTRQDDQELPSWLPSEQVNLGLDLRGGIHLLMEADIPGVLEERFKDLGEALRIDLRRDGIRGTTISVQDDSVVLGLADPATLDQARDVARRQSVDYSVTTEGDDQVVITYAELALTQLVNQIMEQSLEIIRNRIDPDGTKEPSLQRQGEERILLQLPGVDDPERIKELLEPEARLTFRFVDENTVPGVDRIPPGSEVLESRELGPDGEPRTYAVRKRTMVGGEHLIDAQATFQDNQPVVSFRFDGEGARRFGRATQENVGRLFAIVLDDEVISAPVIREPILGGSGVISGRFTTQEVNDLALLLRAGALPASLVFLEERTVGPGLGADSIRAGAIACALGFLFVVVFMAGSYGLFGMIANVALIANLVLIMAALSLLQATLTLPGIAGIVLTIGMAVDANVLIFERIREEARNGRGPVTAIDAGYRRAIGTILDSNLTTLIAAFLLFYFGSGPVKGFAVTLSIGIITSMFTAFMVTRLLLATWLRQRRPQELPI